MPSRPNDVRCCTPGRRGLNRREGKTAPHLRRSHPGHRIPPRVWRRLIRRPSVTGRDNRTICISTRIGQIVLDHELLQRPPRALLSLPRSRGRVARHKRVHARLRRAIARRVGALSIATRPHPARCARHPPLSGEGLSRARAKLTDPSRPARKCARAPQDDGQVFNHARAAGSSARCAQCPIFMPGMSCDMPPPAPGLP